MLQSLTFTMMNFKLTVRGHVSSCLFHKHFREVENERGQDVEEVEEQCVPVGPSQLHVRLPHNSITRVLLST